jgi:pimeloyl-ACP methyl ester carboxylesterase
MTPDSFDLHTLLPRARMLARLCLNRDPDFLASLTTANAARDMDLLRAAVGDEKLNYVGFSWGGMLGETYTSLFPGRTRAIVLDSPVDGDVWLNKPFDAADEQNAGFEDSLDRFLAATGRSEDAFDALLARLDETPLDFGDGRTIDGDTVRIITGDALYRRSEWAALDEELIAIETGDLEALDDFDAGFPEREALYDRFESYVATERRYPHRIQPYLERAEHAFAVSPHFALGAYEQLRNRFWPIRPRSAFYGPYRHAASAAPVLIFHGTHDPATPYAWGKRVVRDLGNARLFTYHGDGHGVITQLEPCVLAPLAAYLYDRVLPPEGASCDQPAAFSRKERRLAGEADRLQWAPTMVGRPWPRTPRS